MRLCLMIEGQEGVSWQDWAALADACEATRIEALFRSDHYVSGMGDEDREVHDAWATICALAARTQRLRLGTLVSPVTFRHPANLAKLVTTADHVSGGRIDLGLGAGWMDREHEAYGFPFPSTGQRLSRLEEQLEVVRRLTSEDEVSFDGAHYVLDRARCRPRPVQARLPIVVGGVAGPRSRAAAAKWADEYNTLLADNETVRQRHDACRQAWADAGRDADALRFSLMTTTIVGRDDRQVLERARAVLRRTNNDADPATWVAERRGRGLIGTVDEVVDRLGELAEAGVDRVMCQHLDHRDLEMVGLLGEEVGGQLAGAGGS